MGFPRQEYWSGLAFPFPGDLPDPGIEPACPALAGRFFTTEPPGKLWEMAREEGHNPGCGGDPKRMLSEKANSRL